MFQRNKVRRSEDKVSTEVQMLKTCVSNNKVLKIRVLKTLKDIRSKDSKDLKF